MINGVQSYHGVYRGVVASNVDPEHFGRLLVRVEDVLGPDVTVWADPSSPVAGASSGFYAVPQNDSGVWVQFVDGDPDRALVSGFWRGGTSDMPPAAQAAPDGTSQIVVATPGASLLISDLTGSGGGIQLRLGQADGPYITLTDAGVEIGAGAGGPTIKVTTSGIDLGDGALTVTAV